MTRLLALLAACVALGAVGAGCGGDDDNGDGGNGGGSAPSAEEPAAPTAEDTGGGGGGSGGTGPGTQVSMKDIKFNPETVKVKAGGKVTWTNDDTIGHDVTADAFESGSPGGIDGGSTYSHIFKKPGTFDYVCSVHPGMKGSVKVTK